MNPGLVALFFSIAHSVFCLPLSRVFGLSRPLPLVIPHSLPAFLLNQHRYWRSIPRHPSTSLCYGISCSTTAISRHASLYLPGNSPSRPCFQLIQVSLPGFLPSRSLLYGRHGMPCACWVVKIQPLLFQFRALISRSFPFLSVSCQLPRPLEHLSSRRSLCKDRQLQPFL